jgi:hypothetical protein
MATASPAKRVTLPVNLSAEQLDAIKAAAGKEPPGAWARKKLLQLVDAGPDPLDAPGDPPSASDPTMAEVLREMRALRAKVEEGILWSHMLFAELCAQVTWPSVEMERRCVSQASIRLQEAKRLIDRACRRSGG